MKKLNLILMILSVMVISCSKPGDTSLLLNDSPNLPQELKGLKIYDVAYDDDGSYIKIAVLNNQINSLTYRSGKTTKSIIMINSNNERIINVDYIISENDSIIVAKIKK